MRRKLLIITLALAAGFVPAVAVAQAPFSSYRQAACNQYPDFRACQPTGTTATPPPDSGQAPATGSGTPSVSAPPATTEDPDPGAGNAPDTGSGDGGDDDPVSGSGNNPGDNPGSGNAGAGGSGNPIRVAPSADDSATREVDGGLPFTGSDLTPLVLLALALVSGGLFLRAAERKYRAGRRTA